MNTPTDPQGATFGFSAAAGDGSPRPNVPGYEILDELGRGGMGVVYRARQARPRRLVALKMLLGGSWAGAADVARFRGEAEAAAQLQHPNIVQVYEVGECQGLPFFSQELVEGGSLARKLEAGPLPADDAARLVQILARAAHHAHQRGVIHRDVKPANVLLAPDGTPKLADFGLARHSAQAALTATGAVLGTPGYLAPEQASASKDVGAAADVYALGATLHAALTGRPPFQAATPLDTILLSLSSEPTRPSALASAVPTDLDTICLKCLEKEPARRYQSAAELADDLGRFLARQSIFARPVGPLGRAWRWGKRNRLLTGLSVLALALLVAVTALLARPGEPRSGDDALRRIQRSGKLRITTDPNCPPMAFREREGEELRGFDVDLMRELASVLGAEPVILERPWALDDYVRQLDRGEVDVVISCVSISEERRRRADFVEYLVAPLVFAARKGVKVSEPNDLAGKRVAVQRDTTAEKFILGLREKGVAFSEVQYFDDTPGPYAAIRKGDADLTLDHRPICNWFARRDSKLVVLGPVGHVMAPEALGIMVSKRHPALKSAIEEALSDLRQSGKFREMLDRWFDE